jgi:homoserine O-succinyltransferase/O-acetyltransferase
MALLVDFGRIPPRWMEKKRARAITSSKNGVIPPHCIRLALINNMPDSAFEDTELQFVDLLDAAAGELSVYLKLYSLPAISRTGRAKHHSESFYEGVDVLLRSSFDGVIVTGTEPRHSDLRREPYWGELVAVLDWAECHTSSTILSCLAAHASILHSHGIERQPLAEKRFGVFEERSICKHPLTSGAGDPMSVPHSRWNEINEAELKASGYSVLTRSDRAGVDLFVKQQGNSLFVHFQGHPEYGARSLLKEYKRDVGRYLKGERKSYPEMPEGYFNSEAIGLLAAFRENVDSGTREGVMAKFPEAQIEGTLSNGWNSSAVLMYSNWLDHLESKSTGRSPVVAHTASRDQNQRT